MLIPQTPFPQAGSYGLYQDPELPCGERRAELARILELGASVALISLPLRDGAGGNRRVPIADLIDGTPLDAAETKELTDCFRAMHQGTGRRRNVKAARARHATLKTRAIWSGPLQRQLDRLSAAKQAKAA